VPWTTSRAVRTRFFLRAFKSWAGTPKPCPRGTVRVGLATSTGPGSTPSPDAAGHGLGLQLGGRHQLLVVPRTPAAVCAGAPGTRWQGGVAGCNWRPLTITITRYTRSPPPVIFPSLPRLPPPCSVTLAGKGTSMAKPLGVPKSQLIREAMRPTQQEAERLSPT